MLGAQGAQHLRGQAGACPQGRPRPPCGEATKAQSGAACRGWRSSGGTRAASGAEFPPHRVSGHWRVCCKKRPLRRAQHGPFTTAAHPSGTARSSPARARPHGDLRSAPWRPPLVPTAASTYILRLPVQGPNTRQGDMEWPCVTGRGAWAPAASDVRVPGRSRASTLDRRTQCPAARQEAVGEQVSQRHRWRRRCPGARARRGLSGVPLLVCGTDPRTGWR